MKHHGLWVRCVLARGATWLRAMSEREARARLSMACVALVIACGCGDDDSGPCEVGETTSCECVIGGMTLAGTQTCGAGGFGACGCDPDAGADAGGDACACVEGEVEMRPTPACGEESRTCAGCAWGEWSVSRADVADPECLRGEGRWVGRDELRILSRPCLDADDFLTRMYSCGSDCRFETSLSECGGGCAGERRTTPADSVEVCIPGARVFTRGCDEPGRDCYPRHDVGLSAFYIDRFTVTVRRYQECVAAGGCQPLMPFMHTPPDLEPYTFDDLEFDDDTVSVWTATYEQAEAFCRWDGAEVMTGTQWERAATGLFERTRLPWDDVDPARPCSASPPFECRGLLPRQPYSFDAHSGPTSTIGLENTFWFFEWSRDTLDVRSTTYALDPVVMGSASHELRSGFGAFPFVFWADDIAARNATIGTADDRGDWGDTAHGSIRCTRFAEGSR